MITLEEYKKRHVTVVVEEEHGLETIAGPRGERGEQGEPGVSNIPGPQGVQGEQGIQGEQGPAGQDGKDGLPGQDGAAGIQGIQGEQGIQGVAGPAGKDGSIGPAGPQGVAGATGAQGVAGVGIKGFASGYVDAGQFVTLDNLKFTVTTSGNRGLSCATVTGTVTLSIAATWMLTGSIGGNSTAWPGATYTTTPQGPWFGYHFPNAGDGSVYIANDYTNGRVYRITLLIGANYLKNFISIERLI